MQEKITDKNNPMSEKFVPNDFTDPDMLYESLVERIKGYHPSSDISDIEKAYRIAKNAHEGQLRKSGEPYIIHPLCVAIILSQLELDKESIVAGILHDVVEDTVMTQEELEAEFGSEVALLVDGVTKLTRLKYKHDKLDEQAENLRKMFLAMAKDIRVIMIKLADRLHNMRTMQYQSPEKQLEKSRETLDIYAPLAHRLGISKIKIELDDLAMKYLLPDVYKEIDRKVRALRPEQETFIEEIKKEVEMHLTNAGIKAVVSGRVKHHFSIYRKMVNQKKTLDEIYDIFALRVIVDSEQDCYGALGVIHEMYKPIPGRIKDYIAMPKPNMYQSLHTTLISNDGAPFEVQIRTNEMHKIAEYGIAAHWKYKEGRSGVQTKDSYEAKLSWLRQILEWQKEMSDNREFMDSLKSDLSLFSDSVYCFTPSGDVKNLPAGSCPVDFAYLIHSAVGNTMVGARVNGQLVNIDYKIKNGDRIEIITSQNSKGPSRDWLKIVKSAQARTKINQWFKREFKEENIARGKELVAEFAKNSGHNLSEITRPEFTQKALIKYGFSDWDSLLSAVGHGSLKEGQVINKLVEEFEKDKKSKLKDSDIIEELNRDDDKKEREYKIGKNGVLIKGIGDVSVHLSRCCHPVPGDEIIGYITRGRGVTIHRTDCSNVLNFPETERNRLIEAEWSGAEEAGKFDAKVEIFSENRVGLLAELSIIFTESDIDVKSVNVRINKKNQATTVFGFEVNGKEELKKIAGRIRSVDGVIEVRRAG